MPSPHPGHYIAASGAGGVSSLDREVGMSRTPQRRVQPSRQEEFLKTYCINFIRPFYSRKPVAGLLTRYSSDANGPRLTTAVELLVNFHLISRDQAVRLVGHAHDCHQFFEHGVGHTFFLRSRGMRSNAVVALID